MAWIKKKEIKKEDKEKVVEPQSWITKKKKKTDWITKKKSNKFYGYTNPHK